MPRKPKPKPKAEQPRRPRGRPVTFNADVADEILLRIAEGESLLSVCRSPGMPPHSTVCGWVVDDREGFADRYARARRLCAERWSAEVLALADESPAVSPDGRVDSAAVQHQRLRVDARKWLLSKIVPRVYGDRVAVDHAGGVAISVVTGVPDA